MKAPVLVENSVDTFHDYPAEQPYWTETVWFGAWIPEAAISIYWYNWFRPVLGIYGGGCLVWDAHGHLPWEIPVYRYEVNAPIVETVDMRSLRLPGGSWLRSVSEGMVYDMGFGARDVELEMRFEGLLPPDETSTAGVSSFFAGHIDQPGRYTGRLRLGERSYPIDCHGIRDRSWGPRILGDDIRIGYCHGQSEHIAFLAYSIPGGEVETVLKGYLMLDGRKALVKSGTRRVCYQDGRLRWVELTVQDELGRSFSTRGRPLNRFVYLPYPNLVTWLFLMEWEVPGGVIYGEEQDAWSTDLWRRRREIPAALD